MRITNEEFIRRMKLINGNKYTYEKTKYVSYRTPVIITTEFGEDIKALPHNLLRAKPGSFRYAKNDTKLKLNKKDKTREFIKKAIKIHGDVYNYSKTKYTGVNNKVIITCPYHGDFIQIASCHIAGNGCPKCAAPHFSKKIEDTLNQLDVKYIKNKGFKDRTFIFPIVFKYYIPDKNLVIDFRTKQHCNKRSSEYSDRNKADYCEAHNIKLVVIDYTQDVAKEVKKCLA